jgi:hypothetical protein
MVVRKPSMLFASGIFNAGKKFCPDYCELPSIASTILDATAKAGTL